MSLPLLPIPYEDGSMDLAVSVPLWYKDAALDLLSRMVALLQFNATTIAWAKDICKEVIVSNRRERGIDWDRMSILTQYKLFLTDTEDSLFWLIQQNSEYPDPPKHLLEGSPADPSPLAIANNISVLITDQRLTPLYHALMEMDAGTAFSSIYHYWARTEDPKKRASRKTLERMRSPEFQNSQQGRALEGMYQSRLAIARQRAQAQQKANHANQ